MHVFFFFSLESISLGYRKDVHVTEKKKTKSFNDLKSDFIQTFHIFIIFFSARKKTFPSVTSTNHI